MELDKIYCGDSVEVLKDFPDNSINCICTSPPYFSLRSYLKDDHPDKDKEIGHDQTPEEYVAHITTVFREARRVLTPDGTLWLNIGDGYAGYWGDKYAHKPFGKDRSADSSTPPNKRSPDFDQWGMKNKDLMGIPWMCAFALRSDGWYLRSDIIYHKRNTMPQSVIDRPTSSHEHVFLFSKSPKYYYDWEAIATDPSDSYKNDKRPEGVIRQKVNKKSKYHEDCDPMIAHQYQKSQTESIPEAENKQDGVGRSDYAGFNGRYVPVKKVRRRDVWSLTVPGSKLKHFAMFNPKLVELCILAGCPPGGIVLDPFMGAGTTAAVALKHGRHYIGVELNSDYIPLVEERIREIQNRV